MDEDDIVEIHPFKKHKRDVIIIDDEDNDSDDLVIIGEKVSKNIKAKTIEVTHQVVDVLNYICLNKNNDVDHSSRTKLSSSRLFSQVESVASQHNDHDLNLSFGVEASKSENLSKSFQSKIKSTSLVDDPNVGKLLHAGKKPAATKSNSDNKEGRSSSSCHANFKDEKTRKFQSFKQFDTISDTSDHYYVHEKSSTKPRTKKWAKIIQKEWKILEESLPDSIFVRVYESRMDLLRAVIIGAEGTPYHDGLFVLDLYFPSNYPIVPPLVNFKSGVNNPWVGPHSICLSLLHTHPSYGTETWIPHVSTTLQVLVSIQGLVLSANPSLNYWDSERGVAPNKLINEARSYNEEVFLRSLREMTNMLRCPPKYFEDFVVNHFVDRAHDILRACKGCMEGGFHVVVERDKVKSFKFKNNLRERMRELVREFARIGVKECEQFLS